MDVRPRVTIHTGIQRSAALVMQTPGAGNRRKPKIRGGVLLFGNEARFTDGSERDRLVLCDGNRCEYGTPTPLH